MITHKFRIYPSRKTEEKLIETLHICRKAYNFFLGELQQQKVIDKSLIQGVIPNMKICDADYNKVHSKTLQMEVSKLFSNLKGLSGSKKNGRKVGQLRFKGKHVFKTFTYNQSGFKIDFNSRRTQTLSLSKIGNIPIRCHRKIEGNIKQITIKHFPSGKWFAFVIEDGVKSQNTANNKVVGIDLGLQNIIYDSDGNSIQNPRHLKQKEKRLKHLQRLISNKKKGSLNRNRFRIQLARQFEKLTDTRDDFLHKQSHYYSANYGTIAIEDLKVKNMTQNRFAKSINDASWSKFKQLLSYKVERTGGLMIAVNPRGTTQRCSQCGNNVPKEIQDRWHKCSCGFEADRDYNSALEIKRLGLLKLRVERPESNHLEMETLLSNEQFPSMNNEAYSKTKFWCG